MHNMCNTNFDTDNWKYVVSDHMQQNDSYNCGVYIIHFFNFIVKEQNLSAHIDMHQYRYDLQKMLLCDSCDSRNLCMFHKKCVLTKTDIDKGMQPSDHYINSICDLCRQY